MITRLLWLFAFLLAAAFLFIGSGGDFDYIIPRRAVRLGAMAIGAVCVAFSTIAFQTMTENRILSPAIMGYEAVYLLLQAMLILAFGVSSASLLGEHGSFLIAVTILLVYSWLIRSVFMRDQRRNIYVLLLMGFVVTVALNNFTAFVQFAISPSEFALLYSHSQTSFTRPKPEQLAIAAALVTIAGALTWKALPTWDVLALGQDHALSLGIDYDAVTAKQLALIAVLVAVSTSLLGPTAFLGVFVANMAYLLARQHRHRQLLPLGTAIAMVVFLVAQLLVEHAFNYQTSVGILINLLCGGYFLLLLIRSEAAL